MQALEIATEVRNGRTTAASVVERCIQELHTRGQELVAVTRILADRAREEAAEIDRQIAAGKDPGPLAGVPFGVKDLFDVAGLPTTAGSGIYADAPAAIADAEAITRLNGAGAVLVATLNMDEFAYGFATMNARHGTTRNPHDVGRLAGGSSGGSAAAVASGLIPFSLGSDTNGSIRVPAGLTGIYGLKPTHGSLPTAGMFPFAASFDDPGPFAASVADLACIWEVLTGSELSLETIKAPRVARLGGWFRKNLDPDQLAAMDEIAPDAPLVELPDIARARSAAFLITAYEGGTLHRQALAKEALAFDPATRDRLLAGAILPRSLYEKAQDFRSKFKRALGNYLSDFDVLLAPAAPCVAPPIDDPRIMIDGALVPARAELGVHTQPISFMGLPALAVPLQRPGRMPLGLQLVGKPGGEPAILQFAAELEAKGQIGVSAPQETFQGELT